MTRRWTSLLFASALGIGLLATTPTISLAHEPHPSVNWRQHHQQSRIYQGVRHGQISPHEYRHLEKQEARLAREEYRFRHNDGHLGPWERARLQHDLNGVSRDIYQDRHD